MSKNKSGFRHC